MNPLSTIFIPAYNSEEWIAETIQSAIAQTWPRKEIIVVDDGSTDRTAAVARPFLSQQVPVVSPQNHRASTAFQPRVPHRHRGPLQWYDAAVPLFAPTIRRQ